MKNFLAILAFMVSVWVVSFLVAFGVISVFYFPIPTSFETMTNSYVQLEANEWMGCGTEGVYNGRVYILTARHVANGATGLVAVTGPDDKRTRRETACIAKDPDSDLALLWVTSPRDKAELPLLAVTSPKVGQKCWYTSSGSGVYNWTESGTVAKVHHKSPFIGLADVTLVTGMGYYGSSGGGVWVETENGYKLIGVVSHGAADTPRTPIGCPSGAEIIKFLKKAVP